MALLSPSSLFRLGLQYWHLFCLDLVTTNNTSIRCWFVLFDYFELKAPFTIAIITHSYIKHIISYVNVFNVTHFHPVKREHMRMNMHTNIVYKHLCYCHIKLSFLLGHAERDIPSLYSSLFPLNLVLSTLPNHTSTHIFVSRNIRSL